MGPEGGIGKRMIVESFDNVSRCTHTNNYIELADGLLKVMKEQVRDADLDSNIDLYPLTSHGSL